MTTFTYKNPGTYDPETGTYTSDSSSTVTGQAVQVRANAAEREQYRSLGLVEGQVVTLLFTPTTYGETPELGSTVSWASVVYTAKTVDVIAPDGVTVAARLGIVR